MGKTLEIIQVLLLMSLASCVLGSNKVVLDSFTERQNTMSALYPPFPSSLQNNVTGTMVGGERDMDLIGISGNQGSTISTQVTSGSWYVACSYLANCQCSITYDGHNSSSYINYDGLGAFDLTAQGAKAIAMKIQTDKSVFFNITLYQWGTSGSTSAHIRFAADPGPSTRYFLPFTSFISSKGMDFTKVGAIVLFDEGGADVDTTVSLFATFANDITGTVFVDLKGDGTLDPGDPGIEGVKVNLFYSSSKTYISSVFSDASGHYDIPTVPGSYYVCASPPGASDNSCSPNIVLNIGLDCPNINLGFVASL